MDNQSIYDRLNALTDGLLYMSESENEFSIYEVEDEEELAGMMEDVADQSRANFREENYTLFFDRVVAALDTSDPVMNELKQKYEKLFDYLQSDFEEIQVLIGGDVVQHIFIKCSRSGANTFLLHTISIET